MQMLCDYLDVCSFHSFSIDPTSRNREFHARRVITSEESFPQRSVKEEENPVPNVYLPRCTAIVCSTSATVQYRSVVFADFFLMTCSVPPILRVHAMPKVTTPCKRRFYLEQNIIRYF